MEQVKAVIRLSLGDALKPFLDIRSLIRAAEGSDSVEVEGPPMTVTRQADRRRISIHVKAIAVEQEASEAGHIDPAGMLSNLRDMSSAFDLPPVRSARLDAFFIEPYDLPFHELVARMRDRLLVPNEWTATATDLAVVIDRQVDDSRTEHMQLGPMMPAQLRRQYLVFPRERLPDQFIFVSAGWTIIGSGIEQVRESHLAFTQWAEGLAQSASQAIKR